MTTVAMDTAAKTRSNMPRMNHAARRRVCSVGGVMLKVLIKIVTSASSNPMRR